MRHVTTKSTDPAVLVGLDEPDDAAVYRVSDDLAFVQTVDFFTPIVDDPYDWGYIAAANALSDIYAMGARPVTALNLVGWPRSLGFELLGRVLDGGRDACDAAGVSIVGGHSVDDPEPKYGLSVTGLVHPERAMRKTGARPGDDLILTKPLGTGVVSSALKDGVASPEDVAAATDSMKLLNAMAAEEMVAAGAAASTDVTGFGLLGHLSQMLESSLDVRLSAPTIPFLPGAERYVAAGILPGGSRRNREAGAGGVVAPRIADPILALLFDAQTSGGLLIAIEPGRSTTLVERLRDRDYPAAAVIGRIEAGSGLIYVEDLG